MLVELPDIRVQEHVQTEAIFPHVQTGKQKEAYHAYTKHKKFKRKVSRQQQLNKETVQKRTQIKKGASGLATDPSKKVPSSGTGNRN